MQRPQRNTRFLPPNSHISSLKRDIPGLKSHISRPKEPHSRSEEACSNLTYRTQSLFYQAAIAPFCLYHTLNHNRSTVVNHDIPPLLFPLLLQSKRIQRVQRAVKYIKIYIPFNAGHNPRISMLPKMPRTVITN